MVINRRNWNKEVHNLSTLLWYCPTCNHGVLKAKKDCIKQAETRRSRFREGRELEINEEGYEALFIGYLECNNCSDVLAISGRVWMDVDVNDMGKPFTKMVFQIKSVNPAPHIFPLPNNCPKEVVLKLQQSFQLFWIDLDAAANKMRQAVESLMDILKVKKRTLTKKGKYHRLDLHQRIELFQAKEKELGELLLAIKWLGNTGSHESAIKSIDIFDAYDIVEQVIEDMFARSREHIASLATEINKIKGPRSKRFKYSTKRHSKKRK